MICRCVPRRPRKAKQAVRRRAPPLPPVGVIRPMMTTTPPVPTRSEVGTLQAPVRAAAREIATQTTVGQGLEPGQQVLSFVRKGRRTAREIADEKARLAAKKAGLEAE